MLAFYFSKVLHVSICIGECKNYNNSKKLFIMGHPLMMFERLDTFLIPLLPQVQKHPYAVTKF